MSRANFVQVQLAAAATDTQTSLSIKAPVGGFKLPPAGGGKLILTDSPGRPLAFEVLSYAGITGSGPYTLTGVVRGLEGTVGLGWSVDAFVLQSLTAGEMDVVDTALAGKVDKVAGQSLMTDAERTKLSGIAAGAQANVATNLGQGTRTATAIPLASSTGTGTTLPVASTTLAGLQSAADKTKLNGIATGATANATDAALRDRATHTGTQAQSTVTNLETDLAAKQATLVSGTSIKTINGQPVLGAGDLVIESGAGLTLFEESRSTASPNATVPVHALKALGDEANIDFVIAPKGTGAILARVPDGTSVGGNKRGAGSVDLQTFQSASISVASGDYSVAMGVGCRPSGTRSVAIGDGNAATGSKSLSLGSGCQATGANSVAIGEYAEASGAASISLGQYVTTRGVYAAIAEGVSTGAGAARGRQQMQRLPLRADTETSSPIQLSTSGSSPTAANTAVMPNNSAYYCRVRVLARITSTNESMSWSGTALIKRGANAASTTLIGSSIASDFGDAAMSACTVTLSADTTRGALAVTVTGLAGALALTVRWVAQLETVEAA